MVEIARSWTRRRISLGRGESPYPIRRSRSSETANEAAMVVNVTTAGSMSARAGAYPSSARRLRSSGVCISAAARARSTRPRQTRHAAPGDSTVTLPSIPVSVSAPSLLEVDPARVLGFEPEAFGRPVAAVHFQSHTTVSLPTAGALQELIVKAQEMLAEEDDDREAGGD